MNFTAKSRYALKLMIDLAEHHELRSRQELAQTNHIPIDFMDHILAKLKDAKLITTIRGRKGGVILNRPGPEITLWDIVTAVEDHIHPVRCLQDDNCKLNHDCNSKEAWTAIFLTVQEALSQKSLSHWCPSPPERANSVEKAD